MAVQAQKIPTKITEYAETNVYKSAPASTVSILWQFPQFVIVTAAEILFSITGLEFSYSQAPTSMKSVMQAVYLVTMAIGNIIIIVVLEANIFTNDAYNYFLFAGIMLVVMVAFIIMSMFYTYVQYEQVHESLGQRRKRRSGSTSKSQSSNSELRTSQSKF